MKKALESTSNVNLGQFLLSNIVYVFSFLTYFIILILIATIEVKISTSKKKKKRFIYIELNICEKMTRGHFGPKGEVIHTRRPPGYAPDSKNI